MKAKLSCEASFKFQKGEDVKMKLSCKASVKCQELKLSERVFNTAVPVHKVSQQMQNTIAQHDQRKTKSPSTVSHTARAIRGRFYAKAMTPETVAQASLLFSAAEAPFTRKNTMFRAIPNTQIASMRYKNEAFVQGFLRIPRPAQL